ncbi:MAG: hypothetical protein IJQ21_12365 [Lachnospiraceae bacterium]|nr:hypothetical protein [Lachnospiraceae bacterium]
MSALHVSVRSAEQFSALKACPVPPERVYLEAARVLLPDGSGILPRDRLQGPADVPVYLALPFITRQETGSPDMRDLETVVRQVADAGYRGVLVRNAEQIGFLSEAVSPLPAVLDYGVYVWNPDSWFELRAGNPFLAEYSLPYELSLTEQIGTAVLTGADTPCAIGVYGRVPMMVSAGCVKMNTEGCTGKRHCLTEEQTILTDRTGRNLPVTCMCRYCYNVIWNAYPLSLHGSLKRIADRLSFAACRVDLTTEDGRETAETVSFFAKALQTGDDADDVPYRDYTKGRSGKGVD